MVAMRQSPNLANQDIEALPSEMAKLRGYAGEVVPFLGSGSDSRRISDAASALPSPAATLGGGDYGGEAAYPATHRSTNATSTAPESNSNGSS